MTGRFFRQRKGSYLGRAAVLPKPGKKDEKGRRNFRDESVNSTSRSRVPKKEGFVYQIKKESHQENLKGGGDVLIS